jgi:hypothetical protein
VKTVAPVEFQDGSKQQTATDIREFNVPFDAGGQVLVAGSKIRFAVKGAHKIIQVQIGADQSGNAVFDIWRDTYANFPPTAADSICGSSKPTLNNAQKYDDTTLNGWNVNSSGDAWYIVTLESASVITNATLFLVIEKI